MATPHGYDDSSRTWRNKIGQVCTIQVRIGWIDEDCKFISKPTITYTTTGGLTFSTYWAHSSIVAEYKNDGCECVQLRITFGGVQKLIFKWPYEESSLDYVICADGSGTARRM